MEYAAVILSGTVQQLQKIFDTEYLHQIDSLTELQDKVAQVVIHLLRTDLNRLLHILYRIDVNEHKAKEALRALSEAEVASQLSALIIKRELQKAQTRFIYRSN